MSFWPPRFCYLGEILGETGQISAAKNLPRLARSQLKFCMLCGMARSVVLNAQVELNSVCQAYWFQRRATAVLQSNLILELNWFN